MRRSGNATRRRPSWLRCLPHSELWDSPPQRDARPQGLQYPATSPDLRRLITSSCHARAIAVLSTWVVAGQAAGGAGWASTAPTIQDASPIAITPSQRARMYLLRSVANRDFFQRPRLRRPLHRGRCDEAYDQYRAAISGGYGGSYHANVRTAGGGQKSCPQCLP